jgi:hypothetical protein
MIALSHPYNSHGPFMMSYDTTREFVINIQRFRKVIQKNKVVHKHTVVNFYSLLKQQYNIIQV